MPHKIDPGLSGRARGDVLNALGALALAASINEPWATRGILIGVLIFGLLFALGSVIAYRKTAKSAIRDIEQNGTSRFLSNIAFSSWLVFGAVVSLCLSFSAPNNLNLVWSIYALLISFLIIGQAFVLCYNFCHSGTKPWFDFATSLLTVVLALSAFAFGIVSIVYNISKTGSQPLLPNSENQPIVIAIVFVPAFLWMLIEFVSCISNATEFDGCKSVSSIIKSLLQIAASVAIMVSIFLTNDSKQTCVNAAFGLAGLGTLLFGGLHGAWVHREHRVGDEQQHNGSDSGSDGNNVGLSSLVAAARGSIPHSSHT